MNARLIRRGYVKLRALRVPEIPEKPDIFHGTSLRRALPPSLRGNVLDYNYRISSSRSRLETKALLGRTRVGIVGTLIAQLRDMRFKRSFDLFGI